MEKKIGKLIATIEKIGSQEALDHLKDTVRDGLVGPVLVGEIEVSDGLRYHIDNNIPLTQSIYRKFSQAYFELLKEARSLYRSGKLIVCADSEWMLDGNLGKFAEWNGEMVPLDFPMAMEDEERIIKSAAEYKGKKIQTGKPRNIRKGEPGYGKKQYVVFVMNGDRVKRISFGDAKLRAKPSNPKARKSFRARHKCDQKKDRTKAGYWACRWPPRW
jgi:hypothetical protein